MVSVALQSEGQLSLRSCVVIGSAWLQFLQRLFFEVCRKPNLPSLLHYFMVEPKLLYPVELSWGQRRIVGCVSPGSLAVSLSDIEIAQAAKLKRATEIAAALGIPEESLEPYGHYKAKVSLHFIESLPDRPDGKLVLVTAISPTPAGEGKTTTTVGLGDALNKIGKKTIICLREPSLGPVFGMKGGAAGGGRAQVVPMEDINLHFTGDFSAIALANNLLAAMIDNHIHH